MKYLISVLTVILISVFAFTANGSDLPDLVIKDFDDGNNILIFSKTAGFRHSSIETGREALMEWAKENGVSATATENAALFTDENLALFDAVVFLSTTQTVFNDDQRAAFKSYIQNGGGFVGIHSATDTEYEWPWYNELVGAYFSSHPQIQTATLNVENSNHPSMTMLPDEFERRDEWYNFRDFNHDVNVLMTLNPQSFEGSEHSDMHPIAWYHEFDGGRVFYTGGGHTEESYSEELFMNHLWKGIEYAMGLHD
ncbi:ThuA domain-containing protein [Rhodohalobacter sp. SW132]|uniref:ThuA domain-containing protein n=1 Tax=Rhodohalobacter sp. SW132 TaxID=2293433 RepID=UPI000E234568|nr:ThuA domain-containing protein [Rhodohalobacter sp. SW132]REL38075.1 ThuA domain-containing protein [Rhodohalobacter sp. SW132]